MPTVLVCGALLGGHLLLLLLLGYIARRKSFPLEMFYGIDAGYDGLTDEHGELCPIELTCHVMYGC